MEQNGTPAEDTAAEDTPAEDTPEISRVDPRLLEILVCPLTKTTLEYDSANQELISRAARLAYPIRDGIPIMLPEEARKIDDVPQVTMPPPQENTR